MSLNLENGSLPQVLVVDQGGDLHEPLVVLLRGEAMEDSDGCQGEYCDSGCYEEPHFWFGSFLILIIGWVFIGMKGV